MILLAIALLAQNVDPQPAKPAPPTTYSALMAAKLPVTTADITDRPYRVIAHVQRNVRKATLFSKGASPEKLERELWERGSHQWCREVTRAMALVAGLALCASGFSADPADARHRSATHKSTKRVRGLSSYGARGTTTGECPCNGGNVCVGPRGGRYCMTSSGNKRYGV